MLNKTYIIYGKMGNMKRFKPVSGPHFVTNKIHAEMYTPKTQQDLTKLNKELAFLNTQGTFELREVK